MYTCLIKQILFQLGIQATHFMPDNELRVMSLLLRCFCCDCLRRRSSDKAGLLSFGKRDDDLSPKQNYTVRRISSFGRDGSQEDIDDSSSDLPEAGEQYGSTPPAEMWNKSVHKVQPATMPCIAEDKTDCGSGRQRGRWHKALNTLRPNKPPKSKEGPGKGLTPSAASSPDIVRDAEKEAADFKPSKVSPHHSGTVANVSSVSVVDQQARWLKCQSMQVRGGRKGKRLSRGRPRTSCPPENPNDRTNLVPPSSSSDSRSPSAHRSPNTSSPINESGPRSPSERRHSQSPSPIDHRKSRIHGYSSSPNHHDNTSGHKSRSPSPNVSPKNHEGGELCRTCSSSCTTSVAVDPNSHCNKQDINSPALRIPESGDRKEIDSTQLARSYGLDTSLYSPPENNPMSRSSEALNAWRTSDGTGDCLQELACGTIHFTANYFHKNKKLFIHVTTVEDLPPKGTDTVYEIILKMVVLPSNRQSKMSRVLRDGLSPLVEEDFNFSVKEPAGKVLRLSAFNADLQGKYDAIGHALFYLEDVLAGRPRRYTMKLYKQSEPDVIPGSIEVCLRYESQDQKLSVMVAQARTLMFSYDSKTSRITDKYNTYAKVTMFFAGQKIKSKKSVVVLNSRNPVYNHSYSFLMSPASLDNSYVVISVMMKVALRKDLPIGRLVLGPHFYAEGSELTPWGRVIVEKTVVSNWFRMYL